MTEVVLVFWIRNSWYKFCINVVAFMCQLFNQYFVFVPTGIINIKLSEASDLVKSDTH